MSFRPGDSSPHVSDDATFYEPLAAERHFWFRARNRIIETLVRHVTSDLPDGYRVLEVGCGTGSVLRVLAGVCSRGSVIGMDFFIESLRWARQRTACPVVQGDMSAPPFGAAFDLIGLFDVLEHLADDHQALRDLHAMLNVGGALLITVPAHPSLWSYWDEVCHHYRRYQTTELGTKLTTVGYRVEYITQFMAPLVPVMWLRRRLAPLFVRRTADGPDRRRELVESELRIIPGVNALLEWMLVPEVRLIARRRKLPLGTSLLAIARKMT